MSTDVVRIDPYVTWIGISIGYFICKKSSETNNGFWSVRNIQSLLGPFKKPIQ